MNINKITANAVQAAQYGDRLLIQVDTFQQAQELAHKLLVERNYASQIVSMRDKVFRANVLVNKYNQDFAVIFCNGVKPMGSILTITKHIAE